ncbi:MAG: endonuclease/exonuclease/phosphatase family protein [Phycisphaeraceae bacterium]
MSNSLGDSAPVSQGRPRRRTPALRFLRVPAMCVLLATFAGLFADLWWALDLLNHFRPLLLVMLVALCCVPSLIRQPVWRLALIAGVAVNSAMVLPIFFGRDTREANLDIPPLTVLAFNVHTANKQHDDAVKYMAATGADLILVQEVNDAWLADLQQGLPEYDVLLARARDDNFGIALLARRDALHETRGLRITSVKTIDPSAGLSRVPAIELLGHWHGRPLAFMGLHTLPPLIASVAAHRNAQLAGAGQWARDHERIASLIIGDLNATPWCMPFRRLMTETDLFNAMQGRWPTGTWHSSLPGLLRLPIDHCLHSRELVTLSCEIGSQSFGSDHRPMLVKLGWVVDEEAY